MANHFHLSAGWAIRADIAAIIYSMFSLNGGHSLVKRKSLDRENWKSYSICMNKKFWALAPEFQPYIKQTQRRRLANQQSAGFGGFLATPCAP
jgi:hypothetical protein